MLRWRNSRIAAADRDGSRSRDCTASARARHSENPCGHLPALGPDRQKIFHDLAPVVFDAAGARSDQGGRVRSFHGWIFRCASRRYNRCRDLALHRLASCVAPEQTLVLDRSRGAGANAAKFRARHPSLFSVAACAAMLRTSRIKSPSANDAWRSSARRAEIAYWRGADAAWYLARRKDNTGVI
jgi:hypothetical protein